MVPQRQLYHSPVCPSTTLVDEYFQRRLYDMTLCPAVDNYNPMFYLDQDLAKINQDRACVVYPFMGSETCALLCVYDGHGEGGDVVRQVLVLPIASHSKVCRPCSVDNVPFAPN